MADMRSMRHLPSVPVPYGNVPYGKRPGAANRRPRLVRTV